jgi:phosphate starvation-inducible PhoH-like protein
MVITGDATQVDLPNGKESGLTNSAYVLRATPGIGIVHFTEADVVRHEIVAKIIRAYDEYDKQVEIAKSNKRAGEA